jgi:hypothetical protein
VVGPALAVAFLTVDQAPAHDRRRAPSTAFAIATDGAGSTLSVTLDECPDRPPVYVNYFETGRLWLAWDLRGLIRRWIAQLDARVEVFNGSLWEPRLS